jgi:uncharacterized protein YbjT (DUF2867 family)
MNPPAANNRDCRSIHVVTGAFGYSGRYIAARLLQAGHRVRTLTNSGQRPNPFGNQVEARPFHFDDPARLVESLRGAATFYNTYWVRFNYGKFTHALAEENTLKLFAACRAAGVRRVVHVSITNASEQSPLTYFRGKARLERALQESGLSCAILRPAVLFGKEDILINNIAWCLRRFPVFAVFGDGQYKLQPLYVDDLASLAVETGGRTITGGALKEGVIYDKQGRPAVRVTANTVNYDTAKYDFDVAGGVRVVSPRGAVISTEKLHWDNATRTLIAPGSVTVHVREATITTSGLRFDTPTQRVYCPNQIRMDTGRSDAIGQNLTYDLNTGEWQLKNAQMVISVQEARERTGVRR